MACNISSIVRRLTGFLTVVVLLAGCHVYRPAEPDPTHRGSDVRVELTAPGAESLAERTPRFGESVEGTLLEVGPDSLRVVSPRGGTPAGNASAAILDTLAIPRAHVMRMERREVDALRTAGLIGGGLAGVALAAGATSSSQSGSQGPTEPGDQGEAAISVPVPLPFP